jgi:hypothetical protein
MQTRVLDLDGSLLHQEGLLRRVGPGVLSLREWGPRIRLACGWGGFAAFERQLGELAGSASDPHPFLTFYGSGDFHHVSLALLRRLRTPCNLLVLDKHPDWMRGIPLLHCGTWLYHAAALPGVGRVFHVGGELDFDNRFRWLAPWRQLRTGKIAVLPARRRFRGRRWSGVLHKPLRRRPDEPAGRERIAGLIEPFRKELAARPLYVSLDKDVLRADLAVVNWDSGYLETAEVLDVIGAFAAAAGGQLAGVDVVGDWSPVRVRGLVRRALDWTEHPRLGVDPGEAAGRNGRLNLVLQGALTALAGEDPLRGLRLFAA